MNLTAEPPRVFVIKGVRGPRRRARPWLVWSIAAHVALVGGLGFVKVFDRHFASSGGVGGAPSVGVRLRLGRPRIDLDVHDGPASIRAGREVADEWPAESADHDESATGDVEESVAGGALWIAGAPDRAAGAGASAPGIGAAASAIGIGQGSGPGARGVGTGTAGGARRGRDAGGRRELVRRGGGSDATERAVAAGLRWLARHQVESGAFGIYETARCRGQPCETLAVTGPANEAGMTGLGLIAFVDAGWLPTSREQFRDELGVVAAPGEVVRRAIRFLENAQRPDGSFRAVGYAVYDDAIATFALCDALAAIPSAFELRLHAQAAVDFLLAARNEGAGWRYRPGDGETDVSATAWCVLALRAARRAGLAVPAAVFREAAAYVASVTPADGRVRYRDTADTEDAPRWGGDAIGARLSCVPAGLLVRALGGGDREDPRRALGESLLLAETPRVPTRSAPRTNYVAWYYGSLELFASDGPSGPRWQRWNDATVATLLATQRHDGCATGSWDGRADFWLDRLAGRIAATALNILTLEVYYRGVSSTDENR